MNKNISHLMHEIVDLTNWSQPRIATELGTSQPTVNRILKGQDQCKSTLYKSIESLHKKLKRNHRGKS